MPAVRDLYGVRPMPAEEEEMTWLAVILLGICVMGLAGMAAGVLVELALRWWSRRTLR